MAELYGIRQAIIFLPCGFFYLLFSSLILYSRSILNVNHTFTNLEFRSEMRCTRLAENTGRKNRQKFANFVRLYLCN